MLHRRQQLRIDSCQPGQRTNTILWENLILAVDGFVWMSAALTALFALPVTILGLTHSRDNIFSFFSLLTLCMLGVTVFLWIK
jgi:hypothetical protein